MKHLVRNSFLAFILSISSVIFSSAVDTHEIADEIENLKQNDPYIKTRLSIEDQMVKDMLDDVQRAKFAALATENKKLKQFFFNIFPTGAVAKALTAKGLVGVDEAQAPKLHAMIQDLSNQLKMPTPFVFIAFDKKLYNAAALSISQNAALVLIGEKLLKNMSDEQLKAILAHELGHVKNNHVPKRLLLAVPLIINSLFLEVSSIIALYSFLNPSHTKDKHGRKNMYRASPLILFLSSLAIEIALIYLLPKFYREQEREADDAAISAAGAQAFVESMEKIKDYFLIKQDDFNKAYDFLKQNIEDLEHISPYWAKQFKSSAKFYKKGLDKQFKKIIEDGVDSHPAMNERIETGKQHLTDIEPENVI